MKRGKKLLSGILAVTMAFSAIAPALPVYAAAEPTQSMQLFVSPTGDDSAAGTLDAPLKTLEGIRTKVRKIKESGLPAGGITVNLLSGEYLMAGDSLELTSEDSGEAGKPIVWKAYQDSDVTFTGTINVDPSNFELVKDEAVLARLPQSAQSKVYVCDMAALGLKNIGPIPKVGYGWPELSPPINVVVDGKSMHLSRYPNSDFLEPGHIYDSGFAPRDEESSDPMNEKGPIWACNDEGLVGMFELLKQEDDIWTYGYFNHTYADDNVAVEKPELDTQYGIKFTGKHPTYYGMKGAEPKKFYVYNLLCALDAPEEYYLDRTTNQLYLYSEKDLSGSKIEFSVMSEPFFNLTGASYVTFEGLHFAAGNANAIDLNDCNNILIADCLFTNMGQKGVAVKGSLNNHDNTIQSCDFKHTGSGAVLLEGGEILSLTPGNNKVDNCYFDDYSVIKRTYTPAVGIFGCGNQVTRNKITNAPHQAIAFSGNNHLMAGNEISNVLYETGDSGAIYTCTRDWTSRGNVITNNYFYDIPNTTHGGTYCIYLDDMASGTIATNNLFTDMKANAFLVGGGRDNVISNNIGINNGGGFIRYDSRCMGWAHKSAHIPDGGNYKAWKAQVDELRKPENEAYLKKWQEQYPGMFDPDMENAEKCSQCAAQRSKGCIPKNAVIENNIAVGGSSYSYTNEVTQYGTVQNNKSFAANTDIGFTAPSCQDFAVKPDSKIEEIQGEDHFDVTQVGMYNDEYRNIPSVQVKSPVLTLPEAGATDVSFASGAAFAWEAVEGAGNYLIEVSDTAGFAKIVTSSVTASTNVRLNELERNTTYYWRVTALEDRLSGSKATSETRSFTTEDKDPAALFESFADPNLAGWKHSAGTPSRTDRMAHAGRFSYQTDEGQDVIEKVFATAQRKVVTIWMYDTMQSDAMTASIVNVAPEASSCAFLGVNVRQGRNYYVTRIQGKNDAPWALTNVKRTEGWHEFKWDYTDGKVGKLYIDNIEVGQIEASGFKAIKIGDPWNDSGAGNVSTILYDDLRVGDPVIAPKAISVELPEEITLDEGEKTKLEAVLTTDIDADMEITWSTDSQETVILPGDGVVVGKRKGECIVSAFPTEDPSVKAECKVIVTANQTGYVASFVGGEGAEGTAPEQMTALEGDSIKLPENTFTKNDFAFAGWFDGKDTYQPNDMYMMPAQNVTFVAQWTEEHVHKATLVEGTEATCTEPGTKQYYLCECETAFEDAQCTKEITNLEQWKVIPATGHTEGTEWKFDAAGHWHECTICQQPVEKQNHDLIWLIDKEPTETTPGAKHQECVCGFKGETVEIPATSHVHEATLVEEIPATCTTPGAKQYYLCNCGIAFEDAECTREIANLEQWKVIPATGHTEDTEWKFDATGHWHECTICQQPVEKQNHDLIWLIDKEPTETTPGAKHQECVCGFKGETVEIPALPHVHKATLVKGTEATCTKPGTKQYYLCNCGTAFEDAECTREITNLEQWKVIPATGHTEGTEWKFDATGHWHVCTICQNPAEKQDHILNWVIDKMSTETTPGAKHQECVCGFKGETVEIPALPHVHKATLVKGTEATCTKPGTKQYYLCNCGTAFEDAECTREITNLEQWKVIPATGHTEGTEWKFDKTGHWHECTICQQPVNKENHVLTWVVDKEATSGASGVKHEECACGFKGEPVEIPATAGEPTKPSVDSPTTGDSTNGQRIFTCFLVSGLVLMLLVLVPVFVKKRHN